MWKRVLILLFASACTSAIGDRDCTNNEARSVAQLLVVPRAGLPLEAFDRILARHGARRVDAIAQINVHVVGLARGSDPHALAKRLRGLPEIESVEVDARVPPAGKC